MDKSIGDEAAISFAVAFYDALGSGWSYEEAFELGCNSIQMDNLPDNSIPTLKKNEHLEVKGSKAPAKTSSKGSGLRSKKERLKELELLIKDSGGITKCPKDLLFEFFTLRDDVEELKQKGTVTHQLNTSEEAYGIPEPPVEFIDRPEERKSIEEPLKSREKWVKTVVIHGMGGTGKTVLAIELVKNIKDRFEKVIWASANESPIDLADLLDIVLRSLGYRSDQLTLSQKQTKVSELLREKRYLLVIDSFERIGDEKVDRFIAEKVFYPSKVLITTRQLYPQASCLVTLEGMTRQQTRRMLDRLGKRQGIKHTFTSDDIQAIYDSTGGLPLAIGVIIGLLLEDVTLANIINALRSGSGQISNDLVGEVSKVELMFKALIGTSWQVLSSSSRRILMSMTFFAAPASEQAIRIVSGTKQEVFQTEIDHLTRLSLLQTNREVMGGDEFRYSVHPLIRSFSSEKIDSDANLKKEIYGEAVSYFTQLMEELGRPGLELTKYSKLEQDLKNCIATFYWCKDQRDFENTFKIAESLHHFLFERGFWDIRIQVCSSAFNLEDDSPDQNPEITWRLAFRAGWGCSRQNNYEEAKQWLEKAETSLRKISRRNIFRKLYQGKIFQLRALISHGEAVEAVEEYKRFSIPEKINDITKLFNQANKYHDEARLLLKKHLEDNGMPWSSEEPEYTIAITDSNQGDLSVDLGHWKNLLNRKDEARQHYEVAQKLYSQVLENAQSSAWQNKDTFTAFSAANLGHVEIWLEQKPLDEIRHHFDKALRIAQYLGRDHTIAWCYRGYGLLAQRSAQTESLIRKKKKKLEEAKDRLSAALDIFERIGRKERVMETRKALIEVESALATA